MILIPSVTTDERISIPTPVQLMETFLNRIFNLSSKKNQHVEELGKKDNSQKLIQVRKFTEIWKYSL